MSSPSLQRRLALWQALSVLAILAVFSLLIYLALAPAVSAVARRRAESDADAVASKVYLNEDGSVGMSEVMISPSTLYTVYTADGLPAYANHEKDGFTDSPFRSGETYYLQIGSQQWLLTDSSLPGLGGSPAAYIRTGIQTGSIQDTTQALLLILLAAVPAAFLCAWLVSAAVARRVLRPLTEITETAEAISAGDFDRRVSVHSTSDEIDRLETSLNSMLDSLETSIEREKQFTSDASHELRTPLAVILGASQTALDHKDASAADYEASIRIIYKKATELQALLSQMLLLARGPAQAKFMELSTLNFSDVVMDIAEESEENAAARQISIHTDVEPDVEVTGDLMLLTRAVMNLVDNGIKYGREGGWLRIRLQKEGGDAVLTVSDNGPGIRPEHLPHIFDRFYRADNSRSSPGFGLGLALVERIASLHHGSVSVSSVPGQGASFSLQLPLADGRAALST